MAGRLIDPPGSDADLRDQYLARIGILADECMRLRRAITEHKRLCLSCECVPCIKCWNANISLWEAKASQHGEIKIMLEKP